MKNYQLNIKQAKEMLREWLKVINAPLGAFAQLNSAKNHETFNKLSLKILDCLKENDIYDQVKIRFSKLQLI